MLSPHRKVLNSWIRSSCFKFSVLNFAIGAHFEHFALIRIGKITWHSNNIPEDKIWLKIGGGKGGPTFKMMLQVGNVPTPNSLSNTVVVCAFEASDAIYNIGIGLLRFKDQVDELLQSPWR